MPPRRSRARTPASLVIIGLDVRGKPHASRFPGDADAEVEAAATLMGMTVLRVEGDPLVALADQLPAGKLFASGKAFVPFVGQELYRKLEAYMPIANRKRVIFSKAVAQGTENGGASREVPSTDTGNAYAKAKAAGKPRSGKYPEDWDKITVGQIVLASAERDDGWWTAHVREIRGDGIYMLEWEEWPGFDRFVCRRDRIAPAAPGL